ncbi:unnamed protein product [Didymodactylos carnosus]|uniref:G protein gamma domain-containing protein n=1 Tax=Didymodactylos carnosus TaxID=1234261 RepID=A0A814JT08_9BILA|nr:unnamed protein product [Didymodactylos carnosus]CAF1041790.1 unnamed protein product [Didymodactylos carnosus]CAF3552619.1 unnamed protein product [Didymodactylos carnosus]CAF3811982.1 unnamed protein product [Didymodactylos carnosus]
MASLQVNNDSIIRRISDNFAAPRSYASEYQAPTAFIIQRRLVEQLRKEAAIKRQNVSTVCKDLVRFITDHQSGDALVSEKMSKSADDWGWLRDNDSNTLQPYEDVPISAVRIDSKPVHLHQLRIYQPFLVQKDNYKVPVKSFRLCVVAYGMSRYSKTVRVQSDKIAYLDQEIQLMIRIYDKRYDKRHSIHFILYGYIDNEKRYAFIADQIVDSVKLSSARHVSDAVLFEGTIDIILMFQNDILVPKIVKDQTLYERVFPVYQGIKLIDPPEIEEPLFLRFKLDDLTANLKANRHDSSRFSRVIENLSISAKLSTMSAIYDSFRSRKQRLEVLFDFLTEGPYLPEQNITEPTVLRLAQFGIACWKRSLAGEKRRKSNLETSETMCCACFTGIALHGSVLEMEEYHDIETGVSRLQNTSPVLRQIIHRQERYASLVGDTTQLNIIRQLVRRVIILFSKLTHISHSFVSTKV